MTFLQIEYFLEVAKCLNVSEAARRLYMSQPTLSRQIYLLEAELNFPLFYRNKKTLQLTPAGKFLVEHFQHILDEYQEVVQQARTINLGVSGTLNIGVLHGHMVWDFFPRLLSKFDETHPNLSLNIRRDSFSGLVGGLYDRTLDLIVTMEFDAASRPGIQYCVLETAPNCLVVPKSHPLLKREKLSLVDFKDEIFIANTAEDSPAALDNIVASCRTAGFVPTFKYAATLEQYMLWVEAGVGIAVLNEKNSLYQNPNLVFLQLEEIGEGRIVLAWNQDIIKPEVSVGVELTRRLVEEMHSE